MGRFDNMSVGQAAIEAYGEEEADGFMTHFHRGAIAKAVYGDENEFVNPCTLDQIERRKLLDYLETIANQRSVAPA